MSYPDAIAFAWFMGMVCFIAWLMSKGHRHKWKEVERVELQRRGVTVGYASFCVCEECGEPRRFGLE